MPNQSHVKYVPAGTGPLVFTLPASNFVAILRPDWLNGTERNSSRIKATQRNQELSKSSCAQPRYRSGASMDCK
jgi:hypothetical protein